MQSTVETVVKRETGERPVRTRHCKRGVYGACIWVQPLMEVGGRKLGRPPYTEIREPGNLPFCWYGKNTSRSRVIDCTVDGCQLQSFCYSVKGLSVFPVLFIGAAQKDACCRKRRQRKNTVRPGDLFPVFRYLRVRFYSQGHGDRAGQICI